MNTFNKSSCFSSLFPKDLLRPFTGSKESDDAESIASTDDESLSADSHSVTTPRARSSLLRFCGSIQQTYKSQPSSPTNQPPIAVLSLPARIPVGANLPPDRQDSRAEWLSLMTIARNEMAKDPKNSTNALMSFNDALAVRVQTQDSSSRGHKSRRFHTTETDAEGGQNEDFEKRQEEDQKRRDIAMTLNCIGIALCHQGTEENEYMAYNAFEKALAIRQDVHGPGHEDCVEVVHNMWIMLHNVHERERKLEENDNNINRSSMMKTYYPYELDLFRGLG